MAITYFESDLYPPSDTDGRADKNKLATAVSVVASDFYGKHHVYLQVTQSDGNISPLYLSETQVNELIAGLQAASSYVGHNITDLPNKFD